MRKLTAGLFLTLDGIAGSPNLWQETFDEDMGAELTRALSRTDTLLLGRTTYQEWAAYWPTATTDQDYARFINTTPKYVASTTLEQVAWGPYDSVQLIRGDLSQAVTDLKRQPGQDIAVQGSPTLVNALLQLGLLDELTLYVHNVVAYQGQRLFAEGSLRRLELLDCRASRSGVIMATYRPRPAPGA
ncbi:riboflavin biosynthesis protein RibD (plasmid) [Deinococcus metallilatus]|uniref:Dihydrofolate reductase n=1 Tax=Deinococcus metallilatus TaxID=1211322 RepID=A0AAJ5F6C9_9DEIO|nr:dihydrofolate reductase family protein [Deinococcus metallilatus]MBB5295709.1 dihydrofolate reductase [Deinococcus metallilatus]QBY06843.1 riboflavin biosynthesis protein RibD [Deinococcus metallilatus]TLK32232.1 riboflavin biosynthesis protein RibD [Deinococcus metallilatus]GMA14240.1 pyrimidine reductase [Deinococcus metallilatus]